METIFYYLILGVVIGVIAGMYLVYLGYVVVKFIGDCRWCKSMSVRPPYILMSLAVILHTAMVAALLYMSYWSSSIAVYKMQMEVDEEHMAKENVLVEKIIERDEIIRDLQNEFNLNQE